jgi:(p)ppGpp synthase/HD superfamily hydrolase
MERIRTCSITLDEAIVFAIEAHDGQEDKSGMPYILHPLAVMDQLESEEERIVAALHDVREDTRFTFKDLKERGCSSLMITALKLITHPENYRGTEKEYLGEMQAIADSHNQIAINVKWADLTHNSDPSRNLNPQDGDFRRLEKYRKSKDILRPFISNYLKAREMNELKT